MILENVRDVLGGFRLLPNNWSQFWDVVPN